MLSCAACRSHDMLVGRPIFAVQNDGLTIAFCEGALALIPEDSRIFSPVALPGYVTVWSATAEANMDAPSPFYWATGLQAEEQLFQVEWVLFCRVLPGVVAALHGG